MVAELGRDADPFMLNLYAALAEKSGGLCREECGRDLLNRGFPLIRPKLKRAATELNTILPEHSSCTALRYLPNLIGFRPYLNLGLRKIAILRSLSAPYLLPLGARERGLLREIGSEVSRTGPPF